MYGDLAEIAEERVELDTVGCGITPTVEQYTVAIDTLAFESDLLIQREVVLDVEQCLLARPGTELASIKVIVSAHTHAEYRCTITAGGVTRLITSASSFGRVLSDITERKKIQAELLHLSTHDPLTGVPNTFRVRTSGSVCPPRSTCTSMAVR